VTPPGGQQAFPFEEPSTPGFEALYARLAEIAEELETGDLPLAQAIELYEEGMRLAQACQRLLANVEQRIQLLRTVDDPDAPAPGDAPFDEPYGAPFAGER